MITTKNFKDNVKKRAKLRKTGSKPFLKGFFRKSLGETTLFALPLIFFTAAACQGHAWWGNDQEEDYFGKPPKEAREAFQKAYAENDPDIDEDHPNYIALQEVEDKWQEIFGDLDV